MNGKNKKECKEKWKRNEERNVEEMDKLTYLIYICI
jgi:hypothetical protein